MSFVPILPKDLFAAPAFLAAALGAAALSLVLAVLARTRAARRSEALIAPALAARHALAPPPGGTLLVRALVALVFLGVGAALARPRWGATTETAERKGADVVIVLDTSASMRAADVSPSRFVLARQAASSLLERLGGDRVALVACEGEAQTLVPLTLDTAAAGLFLDALEPGMGAKPGTSLAAGLAAASELFPGGSVGGKNVVILSDGEDLEGGVDAAIDKAKGEGIVVHTVFVGAASGRGAPVPETDVAGRLTGYKTDGSGSPVLSKPDPDLLKTLAAKTGGTFSVVTTGRTDLEGVAREIDRAARRPLAEVLLTSREERFQIPLGIAVGALGLLLLGLGSGGRGWASRKKEAASAALVLLLLTARGLRAQQVATPVPLTALQKILSTPRGEAKAGAKALDEKKAPEALEHFARQIELDPKDPTGAYNSGSALSRAGQAPEALAALEKARREGKRDLAADATYNAGETLFRGKQYDSAAAAFRETLRLKPGDADAAWNYELALRQAEEQKKQQQDPKNKKDQQKSPPPTPGPSPTPQPGGKNDDEKKKQQQKEDREFESKAKMSREKAEQLLAAIQRSDLEEQKKRIAEQKSKRRVARDW
jgi:Ca-activated chloride channel family protein